MAECRSCHAPIIWAVSESGHRMPLDEEPVPNGTVDLEWGRPGEPPRARVTKFEEAGSKPLYRSHFATCPNADRHRKRGGQGSHRDTRR